MENKCFVLPTYDGSFNRLLKHLIECASPGWGYQENNHRSCVYVPSHSDLDHRCLWLPTDAATLMSSLINKTDVVLVLIVCYFVLFVYKQSIW